METKPGARARSGVHAAEFDPRSPDFLADPYPYYARWQEEEPLFLLPATGDWWATRHHDAAQVLTDPRFVKGASGPRQPPPEYAHLPPLEPSMLERDPPDHTRLRGLVNRAFTPRVVEGLRPRIAEIARELLEPFTGRARIDLMADFAFPLPAIVIAELLGVPAQDRERFKEWSRRIVLLLDPTQPEEARQEGAAAEIELADYFHHLIALRRTEPRGDLIGALLAVEERGDRLSPGELLSMCNLLLIAGHETTTNLIGGGTLALLRDPEQWHLLQKRPDLLPRAVEELLRFEPPVQLDGRLAAEDVEMGGQTIRAGQWVLAVIGAANRDPGVFAEPGRLDVTRAPNPHLSFGRGIHFCLGAPLARLEAQIAFGALVRQLPGIALDAERPPRRNRNIVIRGLASLPLRL